VALVIVPETEGIGAVAVSELPVAPFAKFDIDIAPKVPVTEPALGVISTGTFCKAGGICGLFKSSAEEIELSLLHANKAIAVSGREEKMFFSYCNLLFV